MESFPGAAGYAAAHQDPRCVWKGQVSANGMAWHHRLGRAAAAAAIIMPLRLGLAMEMENGGDVRGSPTRQQGTLAAQPCIGVVFGD